MKKPLVFLTLLYCAGLLLLNALGIPLRPRSELERYLGEEARAGVLVGTLTAVRTRQDGSRELTLEDCLFSPEGMALPLTDRRVSVSLDREPEAGLGSRLQLWGEAAPILPADNPGEFDSRSYYLAEDIRCRFTAETLEVLRQEERFPAEAARRARRFLARGLELVFDERDAGTLKAMLLGDKSSLSGQEKQLYETAGISHVLTVSGLHVSLLSGVLAALMGLLLARIPWQRGGGFWSARGFLLLRGILTGAGVVFYMRMAGWGVSLRRAGVMLLILLLGEILGRSYDLASALALAALTVLIPCPYYLFQASFQLSYGCLLIIGCLFPPLSRFLRPETPMGRRLLLPLLLQLFSLPLVLLHYYEYHFWSLLLNLAAVPLMDFLLPFGLAAGLLARLWLPLGLMTAGPAHLILSFIRGLARLTAHLPGGTVVFGRPSPGQMLLYYFLLLLALGLLGFTRKQRARSLRLAVRRAGESQRRRTLRELAALGLPLLLLFILLPSVFLLRQRKSLTLTSLYVGQGDCHVAETPSGNVYIIDAGSSYGDPTPGKLLPFLKYKGIRHIRFLMLSHLDGDHTNGTVSLLAAEGISCDFLLLPESCRDSAEALPLLRAAEEAGCRTRFVAAGDHWQDGEVLFRVLHPGADAAAAERNEASMVLRVEYGAFAALFTGDITGEAEGSLSGTLPAEWLRADYLKIAHHGSKTSSCSVFLEAVSPRAAVISCGRNNPYGHPHGTVLDRLGENGIRCFRTDREGAVTVRAEADGSFTAERWRYRRLRRFEP